MGVVVASMALIATAACATDRVDDPAESAATSAPKSSAPQSPSTSVAASSSAAVATGCGADELNAMSLRRKLAQMIVVGVTGEADARQIVEREHIGGIFIGSWTDKSILTSGAAARISKAASTPLMVTVDQEGGRVSRLSSLGIDAPSARELAASKTPEQVRALAATMGRQMKDLGVTVDFAPVLDVSDEADDEVIGDRSFGNDPQTVAEFGGAFAAGLSDAGVMPVYKHFPGHGHASGDSHTGVVVTPPLSTLRTSDLVPYRELLAEPGTAGVMVGHLIVPGLTEPDMPASLSPKAMTMLRTGRGYDGPAYDGVIFSDDLSSMAAISSKYPIEQAAVMSVRAGADIALWITTDAVPAVLDGMERAVSANRLPLEQVDQSVVRILRAKGLLTC